MKSGFEHSFVEMKDLSESQKFVMPSQLKETKGGARVQNGKICQEKEVIYLNTGDIQDGKFLHNNFSNPENLPGQAKKSIEIGDILYSEIEQLIREICICKL